MKAPWAAVWPDWHLENRIGYGACGVVYQAWREIGGGREQAAIKVIRIPRQEGEAEGLAGEGLSREEIQHYYRESAEDLMSEVRIAQDLRDNPHIVRIEDYALLEEETTGFTLFIRMEYLTSLPLWSSRHTLMPEDAIRMGREICDALAACHRQKILHRDVKPENIFVDESGRFKLGDFGISRKMERMTTYLTSVGTPLYEAPEVFLKQSYDGRADLYSLGLVLYRYLNRGRLPFMSEGRLSSPQDRRRAMEWRLKGEVIPAPADVPEALGKVILKACAYRPEDRYASAEDLEEALENWESLASGKPGGILKPLLLAALAFLLTGLAWFLLKKPIAPSEDSVIESTVLQAAEATQPSAEITIFPVVTTIPTAKPATVSKTEETLPMTSATQENAVESAAAATRQAAETMAEPLNPSAEATESNAANRLSKTPLRLPADPLASTAPNYMGFRIVRSTSDNAYSLSTTDRPVLDDIVFPDTYDGLPITRISAKEAIFWGNVTLPAHLEKIEANSFNGTRVEETLQIPASVKSIETEAFQDAVINRLEILNGCRIIHENAFAGSSIVELIIPPSVQVMIGALSEVKWVNRLEIHSQDVLDVWRKDPMKMWGQATSIYERIGSLILGEEVTDYYMEDGCLIYRPEKLLIYTEKGFSIPAGQVETLGSYSITIPLEEGEKLIIPEGVKNLGWESIRGDRTGFSRSYYTDRPNGMLLEEPEPFIILPASLKAIYPKAIPGNCVAKWPGTVAELIENTKDIPDLYFTARNGIYAIFVIHCSDGKVRCYMEGESGRWIPYD